MATRFDAVTEPMAGGAETSEVAWRTVNAAFDRAIRDEARRLKMRGPIDPQDRGLLRRLVWRLSSERLKRRKLSSALRPPRRGRRPTPSDAESIANIEGRLAKQEKRNVAAALRAEAKEQGRSCSALRAVWYRR